MVLIARGALVVVVLLGLALGVQTCRLADAQVRLARSTSTPDGPGWTPAAPGPPKIPEIPRGTKVLATVEGGVRYLPTKIEVTVTDECDLGAIDADLHCRTEVVDGAGRLAVWGTLTGFGQVRNLPRSWAGSGVTPPDPREGNGESTVLLESAPPIVHTMTLQRPLLWELRGGYVIPTRAVRLGVTRSLSRRFGLYMDATAPLHEGAEFDVGAGVAVRF